MIFTAVDTRDFVGAVKIIIAFINTLILPFLIYLLSFLYISSELKGDIYELLKKIRRYVIFAVILVIPGFIQSIQELGEGAEFAKNIAIFCFIFFIPFILLIRTKWNYVFFCFILIALLLTSKRGAITGMVIPYFIVVFFDPSTPKFKKVLLFLLPIFITIILAVSFPKNTEVVYGRFAKENELENVESFGSSRGDIWAVHLIRFSSGTSQQQLFGFGFGSSYDLTEKFSIRRVSAHNVYIGIGYQFGIIGLSLYVIFLLYLLFQARIAFKKNYIYSKLILYTVLVVIITGFSEVHFETYYIIYPFFFLGIMIGLMNNKKYNRILEINNNHKHLGLLAT